MGIGLAKLSAGAVIVTCLSFARAAEAFRTIGEESSLGDSIGWDVESVSLTYHPAGSPLADDELTPFWGFAAGAWMSSCPSPVLSVDEATSKKAAKPGDGRNSISWVRSNWAERGFAVDAPAATDVQLEEAEDGWTIVEADLYLNAESFEWGVEPASGVVTPANVLVHEFGHILGLAHPCAAETTTDVPACSDDPSFDAAVMNPEYSATRLIPSLDEREGICQLYPGEAAGGAGGAAAVDHGAGSVPDDEVSCRQELCEFGEKCAESGDCSSGVCLLNDAQGICSRACTVDASCPSGWDCQSVGSDLVCVPLDVHAAGGACSVSLASARDPRMLAMAVGFLALLVARRSKKRVARSSTIL